MLGENECSASMDVEVIAVPIAVGGREAVEGKDRKVFGKSLCVSESWVSEEFKA